MNNICDRSICTGCGLCASLCPKHAITMKDCENTGHYIPVIDNNLCVDCMLCQKNCPSLKEPKRNKAISCYAAWRKDKNKLNGSSSGGVASAFYETAIKNGYVCAGTYLTSEFKARMKCVYTYEETEKFKGSKYIQADSDNVYKECLDALKQGKNVLFIGTPCQCAAMRTSAEKYSEQLLTVELICHGTPSYKIFREYVTDMEKRKKKTATEVSFRSSWGEELTLKENGKAFWKHTWIEDDFLFAFQKGMLFNESCYSCKYANKDRCADITIGDFWKIGTMKPFTRPDCKVSVIVVNTEKGLEFFKSASSSLHLEEREYEEALSGNPNLHRASARNPQYNTFWKHYHEGGLRAAMDATVGPELKQKRIKNSIKRTFKKTAKWVLKPILKFRRSK